MGIHPNYSTRPHTKYNPMEGYMAILVTVETAAEMLGISRSVVYQKIGSEEIESIKIGRSRRIPVEAIEQYVERLRNGYIQN